MARIVGRYDRHVAPGAVVQLPHDARRIIIRGTSGSGKTTLARRIATTRAIPHVELDGIFHQAGWTPLDDERFRAAVASFMDAERWVVCGNYRQVAPLLLDRADTVVLLDLPRRTVMARVLRRSIRRAVLREELWNGNKERVSNLFRTDPEVSIIAWAWTTHAQRHVEMGRFLACPPRAELRLVHVTTAAQLRSLSASLAAMPGVAPPGTTLAREGGHRDGP
jgi:adenylate kinase family enzyme